MSDGYTQPCAHCGRPVDALASNTLYEATGWTVPRKDGGLHHLRFLRRTGRVMHASCAALQQSGGQEALL